VYGGGDVQCAGNPAPGQPWRIGIAHPLRRSDVAAVVTGTDVAVATAGIAERGAHVIDPHTGRAPEALASLTLVGQHLTDVDAYATAAFAMGRAARDWIEATPGIEGLAVTRDGATWRTKGLELGT
jgi:FAD:protein FMN transferase